MKTSLSRARVGALILAGVILFVIGIFLVGERGHVFSATFPVYVNFSAAEGVKPGNIVVVSGYNIGTVSDIELTANADSVRLTLQLSEDFRRFVKADTRAEIKQEGLVGNKIINIIPGTPTLPPLADYGYIQGIPPFALTSLADNVTSITDTTKLVTEQLKRLLVSLNSGQGSLGMLLTDRTLYDGLARVTGRTDTGLALATQQILRLSDLLARVARTVDVLAARSDTTVANANAITRETELLVRNLNSGRGTAGALLADRSLYDSLVTLVGVLTGASIDAGAAAEQALRGLHAMRSHWLLGRVFGGDDVDEDNPPEASYQRGMRELGRRSAEIERRNDEIERRNDELDRRERELRDLERRLGIARPDSARR
jgi:phospholipid/cholesterol/gamma-HCH transport system substrate-binding protein